MSNKKRQHTAALKAKVALEAIKEELTLAQITSKHSIHATQIGKWKNLALEAVKDCFSKKRERNDAANEELLSSLYEQIGRLQTEINWLKKKFEIDD